MHDPEERKTFLNDILNPLDAGNEQELVLVLGAEFLRDLRSAYHESPDGDVVQAECSFVQSFFAN